MHANTYRGFHVKRDVPDRRFLISMETSRQEAGVLFCCCSVVSPTDEVQNIEVF